MKKEIEELIEISRYFGKNKEYIIAGGGNTSYKDDKQLYIKASGRFLCELTENDLAVLDREKITAISENDYSNDFTQREEQVKYDLINASVDPAKALRPSIETPLHNLIPYKFIVHTHATIVNSMLCSKQSKKIVNELFGDSAMFVDFTFSGYTLLKTMEERVQQYFEKKGKAPNIIFLQNHGVFVAADFVIEIKNIYNDIYAKIKAKIKEDFDCKPLPVSHKVKFILPAIRMILSTDNLKVTRIHNSPLIEKFTDSQAAFKKIAGFVTPEMIIFCKSKFLYIDVDGDANEIENAVSDKIWEFRNENKFDPKVILIKNIGLITIDDSVKSADIIMDTFEDFLKICFYAENFGGTNPLTTGQIEAIENWEVEQYRKKVSANTVKQGSIVNKTVVVTGGAQGFGGGIAEELIAEGANVVVADISEKTGMEQIELLNKKACNNKAFFVRTDVSSPESVSKMVFETVREFGGLDVFISNAGVLRAGGLDEMQPETFDFMTRVNYIGYFNCAKYASEIMKFQSRFKEDYFTDIIQINSKSGLKGSNKNFAYAGGKFGGIGLTESFALELMPYQIKVNSICPGNFFDGPLWSDPEKGLFVQYLYAGKVPGAKTVEDVKKFYERQVPAKRGCRIEDVMKAVFYVIEQEYETGQAIPVTGGQIMLK